LKVLMNMCPRFLMSHAGDYYANVEIASLRHRYPDMSFSMVESKRAALAANARIVVLKLAGAIPVLNWKWRVMRPLYYLRFVTYLPESYLRRTKPDVIFAHGNFPLIPRGCRIPMLGVEYFASDRHLKKVGVYEMKAQEIEARRWSVSRATELVTTTPGSKARLEEHIPESRGRITQIPIYMPYLEPVDEEHAIRKHRESGGPIRVLFVGGAAKRKGLPQLIEAIRMLSPERRRRLELTVVSSFQDGPVEGLSSFARVLSGLKTADLLNLMRNAHVFAFPTITDTFGRVIVEAMAAGCAVISSDADPQDWILDYGRAGLLADPESPPAIAEALTLITDDDGARERLGLAALARYREVFHHTVAEAQYRAIFERLASSR